MAARAAEHIFVYYRLQGDARSARATVARLFADLEAATGVCGHLLERRDEPPTWMEVYAPVNRPLTFLRCLDASAGRHRLAAYAVDGRRKVERFAAPRGRVLRRSGA